MSSSSQNPKMYSAIESFPVREPVPEPFINNIKSFINEFCKRENYQSVGVTSSFTYLVNKRGAVIPLYVFQQDIENVRKPVCYHCNSRGWGSNIRSRARFHFVIPSPEKWDKPIEPDVLECKNHVMHGFIHSNGFGHILTIKGSGDGGSKRIDIDEVKKLWDQICCSVHARKISVEDNSTHRGMVSRLLYSIIYGPSWTSYGGYKVHFPNDKAVLKKLYVDSVERLQTTKLESPDMIEIAKKYHVATPTPQNLFRKLIYLMNSKPESMANAMFPIFSNVIKSFVKDEDYNNHIIKASLIVDHMKKKKAEEGGEPSFTAEQIRKEVHGKTVVDSVLAHIRDTTVQNVVVRRKKIGNAFYYYTEDPTQIPSNRDQIYDDLKKIYDHVSRLDAVKEEVKMILQLKVLTKNYKFDKYKVGNASNHVCEYEKQEVVGEVAWLEKELDIDDSTIFTKPEIHVVLPRDKTVGEIKGIIQETWRSVYTVTQNLEVSQINGFESDNTIYNQDDASKVIVRGPVFGDEKIPLTMSYEGGYVNCAICTQGHRVGQLIQCEKCKILGHRKCYGIGDEENIPMYLCKVCHDPLRA